MTRFSLKVLALATVLLGPSQAWGADALAGRPDYPRALSDLRAAKWNIANSSGNLAESVDQVKAISELWIAIKDIHNASKAAGQPLSMAGPGRMVRPGNMDRALHLMERARGHMAGDDASVLAGIQRDQALEHLTLAMQQLHNAMQAASRSPQRTLP
jgi:nicotinamidase-related amidase